MDLNVSDFERAGIARKGGNKFGIEFSNGRVNNVIISSPLAKDLSTILLQDAMVKDLFMQHDYRIAMNTKYQLGITCIVKAAPEEEAVEVIMEDAAVAV